MDIREVRHQSNPLNEPQNRGPRPQSLCPGCSSALLEGDRFCQECGARVTANRAKKHAREIAFEQAREHQNENAKASRKSSEPGHGRETQFTANILCINCGAKNSPVSIDCNFCKKALVPGSGDGTGRKAFLRDFLVQGKPQRRRFGKDTADRLPVLPAEKSQVLSSTRVPYAQENLAPHPPLPATLRSPETSPSTRDTGTTGDDTSRKEKVAASSERNAGLAAKQRIPRAFASPPAVASLADNNTDDDLELLFSTDSELSQEWTPESKIDRIAAEKLAFSRWQRPDPAFGNPIVEPGTDGSSLYTVQTAVEAFFERVPVPIFLFVSSLIIVITTIHLTTQWQKQEKRLSSLDKLADVAEHDMKAYKLDDAVKAMTEIEKTEGGNLPPRARSILNQSLWLRAYAYAKKNRYDLAIEDMKRVTPAFNSFDDASEKLEEYKEEVKFQPASAKNLARPSIGPKGETEISPDLEPTDRNAGTTAAKKIKKSKRAVPAASPVTERKAPKVPESKVPEATECKAVNPGISRSEKRARSAHSSPEAPTEPVKEREEEEFRRLNQTAGPGRVTAEKQAKNGTVVDNLDGKEGKMSSGIPQASDTKRYSNLLIKYFSEAHDSEPPSFEEWQSSGKEDF